MENLDDLLKDGDYELIFDPEPINTFGPLECNVYRERFEFDNVLIAIDRYQEIITYLLENGYVSRVDYGAKCLMEKLIKKTSFDVRYRQNTPMFGRQTSHDATIQQLSIPFRTFITGNLYVDFDMVKSHPTIYEMICANYELDCTEFCNNNLNLENRFTIKMMYGGDTGGYEHIASEILKNIEVLKDKFPDIWELKKYEHNSAGKFLSLVIQDYENKILMFAVKWFERKGYQIGTLMFDGFFVYDDFKTNFKHLIPDLEAALKKEFNWYIQFKIKEHEPLINLELIPRKLKHRDISIRNKSDIPEENFVNYRDLEFDCRIVCINSFLGTGKTTATRNFLKNNPGAFKRVIVLIPRITYGQSIINEYNSETGYRFQLYKDTDSRDILANIIIQVESMYRLNIDDLSETLIVVDEAESIMTQLTSSGTHKHHKESVEVFHSCLTKAKKVLIMDAFLTKTNKALTVCKHLRLDFKLFDYVYKPIRREIKFIEDKNDQLLLLADLLNQGKKIFFYCSSAYWVGKINDYLKIKLPQLSIGIYTGENKASDLSNVNAEWTRFDLVIITCTITIGIDFNVKEYFDYGFAYASQKSNNLIRDMFQAFYRVRNFVTNKFFVCVDMNMHGAYKHAYEAEEHYIRKQISRTMRYAQSYYKDMFNLEHVIKTGWLYELVIMNEVEKEECKYFLRTEFEEYAEYSNYHIIDEEIDISSEELDIMKDILQIEKKTQLIYDTIPLINVEKFKELFRKKNRSDEELLSIAKFKLHSVYSMVEDNPDNKKIFETFLKNQLKLFSIRKQNIYNISGHIRKLSDFTSFIETVSKKTQLPIYLNEVCKALDIQNTWTPREDLGIEKIKEMVKTRPKYMEFCEKFEIKPSPKFNATENRSILALLNNVFDKHCISHITSKKKRFPEGRRQAYFLELQDDYTFFNFDYIKYSQQIPDKHLKNKK